jgi:ribonuclease J
MRTLLSLIRPRAMMPVHGEYRMLAAHGRLARDAGVPPERVVIAENGSVVELDEAGARIVDRVPAGIAFVDGLTVGDVKDASLRDRRHLAEDGVLIVVATVATQNGHEITPPEVIARGFSGSEDVLAEAREEAEEVLRECLEGHIEELKLLQEHLHDALGQLIHDRTGRRPMILPVVLEV